MSAMTMSAYYEQSFVVLWREDGPEIDLFLWAMDWSTAFRREHPKEVALPAIWPGRDRPTQVVGYFV